LIKFKRHFILYFALLGLILQSCSFVKINQKRPTSEYRKDIIKYKTLIKKNPQDDKAYLELGVISYELHNYAFAKKLLTKSFRLNSADPKTLFYLGKILEEGNKKTIALKLYKRYTKVSRISPYRKQLAMRYQILNREIIHDEMKRLISQEQNLSVANISPKSVAVFPFTYQGRDKRFAALGTGIGEMMITDLSQVNNLKVIERIRLQTMLNEISMGQSGMVKESTAPRFGKLLGAAKIVHGDYDILDNKNLQMDVAFWDVKKNYFPGLTSQKDALRNIFKMEKDMVFSLIHEMGIELSAKEKIKIQQIPTKSMQAFLSYCMGLEMEDAGQFNKAAKYFQQAVQKDPNFKKAAQQIETNQTLAAVSKTEGIDLNLGLQIATTSSVATTGDLVNSRLNNISASIGSVFMPGQDSRKPVQEASQSDVEIFGDLPLPPAQPIRR